MLVNLLGVSSPPMGGGATHQSFVNRVNNNIGGPMGAGGMEVTVSQNSDLDPPVPVINYTYLL